MTTVTTGNGKTTVRVTGGKATRVTLDQRTRAEIGGQRPMQTVLAKPSCVQVEDRHANVRLGGVVGMQGPPGKAGDLQYSADLTPPGASFVVAHGLNKNPSVSVVDTAASTVDCKVTYIDANTLRIESNAAFSGTAFLN